MIKIAVCDDDTQDLAALKEQIADYLRARPELDGEAAYYASGPELLAAAERRGGFDVYVLDILMPGSDGIETGQKLRAMGDGGAIIYLTNSNEFAADSYEVQAFFYLLKPVEREKLWSVLDRAAAQQIQRRQASILVPVRGGMQRLPLERILYVERVGRIMRYYCTDGWVDTLTLRTAFRDATAALLADSRFYLCGASYVFNLQHVTGVANHTARLDNGAQIHLPRTCAAAFKDAWGRFWLEGP